MRQALDAALAQNALLVERVQELEARLAKDSHNSGKPPSSGGLGRKTKSLRKRSGKKPGGQIGHQGETLRLAATPDVVEQRPAVCTYCQKPLGEEAAIVLRERRRVQDLPAVRLQSTEHQTLHVRCPACAHVCVGVFPEEAPSRAQYGPRVQALAMYLVEQQLLPYARTRQLLRDLGAAQVSLGPLVRWVGKTAATLELVEEQVKAALRQAPVLHCDETDVRRPGELAWAHVTSTSRLTQSKALRCSPRLRPSSPGSRSHLPSAEALPTRNRPRSTDEPYPDSPLCGGAGLWGAA